jgi:hypothetical protein
MFGNGGNYGLPVTVAFGETALLSSHFYVTSRCLYSAGAHRPSGSTSPGKGRHIQGAAYLWSAVGRRDELAWLELPCRSSGPSSFWPAGLCRP